MEGVLALTTIITITGFIEKDLLGVIKNYSPCPVKNAILVFEKKSHK
jgi:hypothetical protein